MHTPIVFGIVAVGPNGVIGHNGQMPWYSRADFYHFRTITTPWPCIFGKNTFDGLPKKPLPNRLNIVCSSKYNNTYKDNVFYADSVESAIKYCKNFDKVFICGGGAVYKYTLENDLIDIMYLTKISSDALSKQIKQTPNDFAYFPINTDIFFDKTKWKVKKIIYPTGILPTEINDLKTEFFRCVRVR